MHYIVLYSERNAQRKLWRREANKTIQLHNRFGWAERGERGREREYISITTVSLFSFWLHQFVCTTVCTSAIIRLHRVAVRKSFAFWFTFAAAVARRRKGTMPERWEKQLRKNGQKSKARPLMRVCLCCSVNWKGKWKRTVKNPVRMDREKSRWTKENPPSDSLIKVVHVQQERSDWRVRRKKESTTKASCNFCWTLITNHKC